jgi:hypothetical protein
MKKNDLIALVIAIVALVGVGYYYVSQDTTLLKPSASAAAGTQVEVAPVIPSKLDPDNTLQQLSTTYQVNDYKQPVVTTGLGNPAPFVSQ